MVCRMELIRVAMVKMLLLLVYCLIVYMTATAQDMASVLQWLERWKSEEISGGDDAQKMASRAKY
jgi:hypothetical protein